MAFYILVVIHLSTFLGGAVWGVVAICLSYEAFGSWLISAVTLILVTLLLSSLWLFWIVTPWTYPMRVMQHDAGLSVEYLWHTREIRFLDITYARKMLPRAAFVGDYSLLFVLVMISGSSFPHNILLFRIRSKNLAFTAEGCTTSLDPLFEQFQKKDEH